MADQHTSAGHPAMDYAEHDKTYTMFVGLFKWGTIACVALVVFMAVTLL
jgi:Bacterial aa3 type cytochrome c oxidase subunit IV